VAGCPRDPSVPPNRSQAGIHLPHVDNPRLPVDNSSAIVDDAPLRLCTDVPVRGARAPGTSRKRCNGATLHTRSRFTAQNLGVPEESVDKWVNLWMNLYLTLRSVTGERAARSRAR